jgi:hypothetical protein
MSKKGDLSSLLGNLALKEKGLQQQLDKKSQRLQQELSRVGFRIFECFSDLGYFSWNPPTDAPYQNLASVTSANQLMLSSYLNVHGRPDRLVNPKRDLRMPQTFLSLPPHAHKNQFPHGKLDVVCFHVAAQYRGMDFGTVDFAFGGSTLELLANGGEDKGSNSDPFMVTRLPGTKTIMVVKNKDYLKNLSDVGFQFERLVTGRPMDDAMSDCSCVEHLHLMNIGSYRVFFRAETDAILSSQDENDNNDDENEDEDDDDGCPVEIKASNPRYWGTKVMFQMISSGSTKLCHGAKGRGKLIGVEIQSLQQVARTALKHASHRERLERNILKGMDSIQSQMKDATPGEVFKISFHASALKLLPVRGRSADILPPAEILRDLISPKPL